MRITPVVFALALALPAASLQAQSVSGGVVVHSGPVSARILFGPRPYYPPPRRVLVVRDYSPRVIVVRRVGYRGHGYWQHHGYRTTTVWYDDRRDCFYPVPVAHYPGLRPVEVYQRDGGYYLADQGRDGRGHHDRDRDDRDRDDRDHRDHSGWEHNGR